MRITTLVPLALFSAAIACNEPSAPTGSQTTRPQFITNGVPTGSAFGAVGDLLFDFDGSGTIEGFETLCTGSLIAPTVFLTAGHCVLFPPDAQLYVSFDPAVLPGPPNVIAAESFHSHPALFLGGPGIAKNDLGVVILPAGATSGITPLQLPPAGLLDQLAAHGGLTEQLFLNVGYGVFASSQGPPSFFFDGVRRVSKSRFKGLTPDWLDLLMSSSATGEGGQCFGDSGGPKFLDESPTMVVGVTSWSDATCRGTGFAQRIDTPSARGFLGQFVSLP